MAQTMVSEGAGRPSLRERMTAAGRWTIASWAVFLVCAGYVLGSTLTNDFRDEPLAGDTSAHLMQALSLAYDSHSFNFDRADLVNWKQLGWASEPVGMFFQRYDGDRYGVAKPYGYSLYLAPFIGVLGPVSGVAVANSVLLALLMAISILLLRTRYKGPAVPLSVGAFFLASYVYMYAFWIHTELFLALIVLVAFAAATRFAQTDRPVWALLSVAAMGFGLSEKASFIALFAPIGLMLMWKANRTWLRIALPLTGVAVFALAVLPYLRYSDWKSFTPYGGEERLYVSSGTPFAGGTAGFSATTFSEGALVEGFTGAVDDKLVAVYYTVVGRYTGLLVYLPLALLLVVAGIAAIKRSDAWGRGAVLSVLAYVVFYAVIFPLNYFGGGQTLGNRYFLQAAPAIIAMVVLVRLSPRVLIGSSLAAALIGVVLLWPHHSDPANAHVYIERSSALQRLLPFESNQDTANYFECEKQEITDITACL